MQTHFAHRRLVSASRGGFTLVEMLVATTLVVMMMLMFAQIYVTAIGSLSDQQAIARNDSKARLADMLIRGDLRRGSYRAASADHVGVFPASPLGIHPLVRYEHEAAPGSQLPTVFQKGFFYISENNEFNPLDDVLHFTTFISRYSRNRDPSYYYGRAQTVRAGGAVTLGYDPNPAPASTTLFSNHPDIDDATVDGVGGSRAIEVSYFVRNGNLYRRSLLIRDLDLAGNIAFKSAQPSHPAPPAPDVQFRSQITPGADVDPNFYKSFDYSAYVRADETAPGNPGLDTVQFLGMDALENDDNAVESLGRSRLRFGTYHDPANQYYAIDPMASAFPIPAPGDPYYDSLLAFNSVVSSRGRPVEFDSAGEFFGRPKHSETEYWKWGWPGNRVNPLGSGTLVIDPQRDQLRANFGSGLEDIRNLPTAGISRETEDLLLTNIEAFDIEVWDPGLYEDLNDNGTLQLGEDRNGNNYLDHAAGWVQLGNTTLPTGYFRAAHRTNSGYGPGEDTNGNNAIDAGEDRNGNGVLDHSAVFDTGHPDMWTDDPMQRNYEVPSRTSLLKPPYRPLRCRFNEDTSKNGSLDPGEDLNGNGVLDGLAYPFPVKSGRYWDSATASSPGYAIGDYVFAPGDRTLSTVYQCKVAGAAIAPALGGNAVWEEIDNRIGLQKIRLTIRYRDSIEGLPRQISIIHSFVNPQE
jgi:hypothetical protein